MLTSNTNHSSSNLSESTPNDSVNEPQQTDLKVLFVDDEPNILRALKRLMRNQPFKVDICDNPEHAIDMIKGSAHHQPYAAIVSDQRMPGMCGAEVLAHVRKHSPHTIRLILTGYADMQSAMDAINRGGAHRYIAKPWDDVMLQDAVRGAVHQYATIMENARLHEEVAEKNEALQRLTKNMEAKVFECTREVIDLNRQLEDSIQGVAGVLASLASHHSDVLGNHSQRVLTTCDALGKQLGLSKDERFQLSVAAQLHDVGKISLSQDILAKPVNNLSPQEMKELQTHPLVGAQLLAQIPHFEEAAMMVRHHHEYYNGSGYPHQLSGRDIPLGARILSVADAYDKHLNQTSTFHATTPEKTLAQLAQQANTHFDPAVVSALKQLIDSGEVGANETKEVVVGLEDVRTGMVLAQDLMAPNGLLVLKKESEINPENLQQITKLLRQYGHIPPIHIYRKVSVDA